MGIEYVVVKDEECTIGDTYPLSALPNLGSWEF
jgi:hypothetical protein